VLAGVLMGAAVAGGTATANAQYYPPPYGYGYGGPTWNGCPPGYTVQGGNCAPYRGPTGGGWRQATRCRAAIVRPIKVRSAAIRDADGTAIELKLTPALSVWRTSRQTHPEFCRENFAVWI